MLATLLTDIKIISFKKCDKIKIFYMLIRNHSFLSLLNELSWDLGFLIILVINLIDEVFYQLYPFLRSSFLACSKR